MGLKGLNSTRACEARQQQQQQQKGTRYFKKGAVHLESATAHHKQVQRWADVMLNPQRMKECPELKTIYVTV